MMKRRVAGGTEFVVSLNVGAFTAHSDLGTLYEMIQGECVCRKVYDSSGLS